MLLCLIFCLQIEWLQAQFTDHFLDGNFNQMPTWIGDTSHFTVTPASQLQLMAPAGSSRSVLATQSRAIHQASWEWWMRLDFNPSSANYADVYLISNRPELDSALQGYFVRIGNTTDEVSLYRQNGSSRIEIIDGLDGVLDRSSNRLKVRVTRDASGQWQLESDTTSTGNHYRLEGVVTDLSIGEGNWFGVRQVYSASRANHFYYDDFIVNGSAAPDTLLPVLTSARIELRQALHLSFNKAIPAAALSMTSAYHLAGIGHPFRATAQSDTSVVAEWLLPFTTESWLNFHIMLQDSVGNRLDTNLRLFYLPFRPHQLIINEILADPSPMVGLPETEMIELFNNSAHPLTLNGWTIEDPQTKGKIPYTIIAPGEFLLLIPPGSQSSWMAYGKSVEVSPWPSMNNDRDHIWLKNEEGDTSDSLIYDRSWLGNTLRQEGGWTLERVSPNNQCIDPSNWQGSTAVIGGSPGATNSRYGQLIVPPPPKLQLVRWLNDTLSLHFSAPVRLGYVKTVEQQIEAPSTGFQQIHQIYFSAQGSLPIDIGGWINCHDQTAATETWMLSRTHPNQTNGLSFSEIYFRPRQDGAPYIELVNHSTHTLPLTDFWITSFDDGGEPQQSVRLGLAGDYILPNQLIVFTRDTAALNSDFGEVSTQNRRQVHNLPTIYTSGGILAISHEMQQKLETIAYHDSMHHSQLVEKRGMALEKPQGQWHLPWGSPVFAKRGSPGSPNSRSLATTENEHWWQMSQEIFRPQKGEELHIQLLGREGAWMELLVYDAGGMPLKELLPYQAVEGNVQLKWDGTDNNQNLLSTGAYLLVLRYTLDNGENGSRMKRIVVDNLTP